MTEIGLYVHVPFCASKCGYCDFYSTVPAAGAFEPLVEALLGELEGAVFQREVAVATIFVGGGTPTLLPPDPLQRLFAGLTRLVERDRPAEFSVEANPATLTDEKAAILRAAGVNRISMGAQTFHPGELAVLERLHRQEDIASSVGVVRRHGFEHLNLDLIFGIHGQTAASWAESIRRAVELGPDHLACYGLTFEPGTPLHARREAGLVAPMDEGLEAELYLAGIDRLAEAGFEQYEISNFARPGGRCRHNLRYWHNQPGIGIGPAAASYLNGRRWRNVADTAEYVRRVRSGTDLAIEAESLDPLAMAGELAMLELRLVEGIDCTEFRRRTGFDPRRLFGEVIARWVPAGLMAAGGDRIALTRGGRLLADAIVAEVLPTQSTGGGAAWPGGLLPHLTGGAARA